MRDRDPRRRLRDGLRCRISAPSSRPTAATELDASLLLLPLVGFLPPDDPRVRGTVEAIERQLLVRRLRAALRHRGTDDGLPPGEGAFLAVQLLARRCLCDARPPWTSARVCSSGCLALRNDVGLLAEEYDPRTAAGRQFPAGRAANCQPAGRCAARIPHSGVRHRCAATEDS